MKLRYAICWLLSSSAAAAANARDLDVVIYGAYGCVGHLTASHLAAQPSLRWAIAGRNETKLEELAATLADSPSPPEVIVSDLGADGTPEEHEGVFPTDAAEAVCIGYWVARRLGCEAAANRPAVRRYTNGAIRRSLTGR